MTSLPKALAIALLQTSDSPLSPSRASGILHSLYVIAAVLGVLLLLVIALAVHLWRKNKNAGPYE